MRIFIRLQEPLLHFNDLWGPLSQIFLRKKNTEIVIITENSFN